MGITADASHARLPGSRPKCSLGTGSRSVMYGLQACLSTGADETATMSCSEAEAGTDDDMELAGTDSSALSDCTCTLEGAVDYCAAEHTSTDLETLKSCEESDYAQELFDHSNTVAVAANSGVPLWVNINGVGYSYSTNSQWQAG